jgi:predicted transposase/invertase (TIGR01784 family)
MEDEPICRQLLEILLPIKIEKIDYLSTEKEFHPSYKGRSIRLDVFLKDSNRTFDIEIQTSDFTNLPMRARFYQGAMDASTTQKRTKFSKLKESYVLFICTGDPFKCKLPVYTVKQTFFEKPDFLYDDRSHKVFYNCKAYKVADNEDLRGLMEFIQTNKATTDFSRKLEENVKTAKQNTKWEDEYMFFTDVLEEEKEKVRIFARKQGLKEGREEGLKKGLQEGREEGLQQGIQQGIQQGAHQKSIDAARNLLKINLGSYEQIAQITELSKEEIQKLAEELQKTNEK